MKALTSVRKGAVRKNTHRITSRDEVEIAGREEVPEIAELGESGVKGNVGAPEQPFGADSIHTGLEHTTVNATPRQIDEDILDITYDMQCVQPVSAPTDMRENKRH